MRVRWLALAAFVGLCGMSCPSHAASRRYEPARPDAERDAIGILELGPEYLDEVELPGDPFGEPTAFTEIDGPLLYFLKSPLLQPAVQFSCARMGTPGEERLTAALQGQDDAIALLALAALVRVQSPSTVDKQVATLKRLKAARPEWKATLAKVESRFAKKRLAEAIAEDPPEGERYGTVESLSWALRATGVMGHESALPRLSRLCVDDHLHTSLAAERSIEDLPGAKADAALATCVEGWQYNAAHRAFDALATRDAGLARDTLLAMTPPSDRLYTYAAHLVQVADASVVPRLIDIIPSLDHPYSAIDALETHAQPAHRGSIVALVPRVEARYREQLRKLAKKLGPPGPLL